MSPESPAPQNPTRETPLWDPSGTGPTPVADASHLPQRPPAFWRNGPVWIVMILGLAATAGAWWLSLDDAVDRPGLAEDVLLVGCGFSVLLAMMARLLVVSRTRALELAEAMTAALRRSESRCRRVVDSTAEGFAETDGDGRLVAVNDSLCRMLGYERAEMVGRHAVDFATAYGRRVLLGQLARRAETEQRSYELALRAKDGHEVLVRVSSTAWVDAEDGRIHSFALLTDLTNERRLEDSQRQAAAILNAVRDGIMVTDLQRRILRVNPAFTAITGYAAEEAVGQSPALLASGQHGPDFYDSLWRTVGEQGFWQGDMCNRRKDGALFTSTTTIVPIHDDAGNVTQFVDVLHDITHRKEDEDRAWHLANYDALTGLPNRLLLQDRLVQALGHAQRLGNRFAVLYVDLDGFKPVNDRFGHAAGDALLQRAAHRLQGCVRSSDTVARLGGDEFVVILPDTSDRTAVDTVARKVLTELRAPYELEAGEAVITASVGVALFPFDALTVDTLLAAADRAMYRAKSAGKNRTAFAGDASEGVVSAKAREPRTEADERANAQPCGETCDSAHGGVE